MQIADAYAQLDEAAWVAAARGSLIFHLDLATEAARAAFARRGIATDRLATMADVRGYRVIAFDDSVLARAVAGAQFDADGEAIVHDMPADVPPRASIIAQARRTIAAEAPASAAIVIPSSDPWRPIEGYALTLSGSPEVISVAGHTRLTIDPTGRRVIARTPIDAAIDPAAIAIAGRRDISIASDAAVPDAVLVYLGLKHGVSLSIHTSASGLVWRVAGERVSRS